MATVLAIVVRAWVAGLVIVALLDVSFAWFVYTDPEGMREQALAHGIRAREVEAFLLKRGRYVLMYLRATALLLTAPVRYGVAFVVAFARTFWHEVTRPR